MCFPKQPASQASPGQNRRRAEFPGKQLFSFSELDICVFQILTNLSPEILLQLLSCRIGLEMKFCDYIFCLLCLYFDGLQLQDQPEKLIIVAREESWLPRRPLHS